jgi:hypothetical protein
MPNIIRVIKFAKNRFGACDGMEEKYVLVASGEI